MTGRFRCPAALLALGLAIGPAAGFDIQGHRGARGHAPENTLAGVARALAIGVSTVELDLVMTRDGVLVAHHDLKLNPDIARRDGAYIAAPGPVLRSLTLSEINSYDVGRIKPGSGTAKSFPGQKPEDGARIPTLAEVLDLVKRSGLPVGVNLETKLSPLAPLEGADPGSFALAVANAVRQSGLGSRVTVQSFDWRTLQILRAIAPEIRRSCLTSEGRFDTVQKGRAGASPWLAGFDVDDYQGSAARLAAAAACTVWSPNYRDLTAERVTEAKDFTLEVIPWTVNERRDMIRLIEWGVDGIITDYPDRLRAVLSARGMPLPKRTGER